MLPTHVGFVATLNSRTNGSVGWSPSGPLPPHRMNPVQGERVARCRAKRARSPTPRQRGRVKCQGHPFESRWRFHWSKVAVGVDPDVLVNQTAKLLRVDKKPVWWHV